MFQPLQYLRSQTVILESPLSGDHLTPRALFRNHFLDLYTDFER
jgi:hypothetical protein